MSSKTSIASTQQTTTKAMVADRTSRMAETVDHIDAMPQNTLLPDHLLDPSETVVLMIKPSMVSLIAQPLYVVLALVGMTIVGGYLAQTLDQGFGQREVIGVGVGLIALRIFWQFLDWLGTLYVLTDRRMIHISGILRPHILHVPIREISELNVMTSKREQYFSLGSLVFSHPLGRTAWSMIARPKQVFESVQLILRRYR